LVNYLFLPPKLKNKNKYFCKGKLLYINLELINLQLPESVLANSNFRNVYDYQLCIRFYLSLIYNETYLDLENFCFFASLASSNSLVRFLAASLPLCFVLM